MFICYATRHSQRVLWRAELNIAGEPPVPTSYRNHLKNRQPANGQETSKPQENLVPRKDFIANSAWTIVPMQNGQPHPVGSYSLPPTVRTPHLIWAVLIMLGMDAGTCAGGLLFGYIFKSGAWIAFGAVIFGAAGGLGTLWFGLCHRLKWNLNDLGFQNSTHSLWHLIWWAPLTLLISATASAIVGSISGVSPSESGLDESTHLGLAAQTAVIIGTVIAMPFLEEVVFRRVLLDWLQQHTPAWAAGLISVLAFAGAHIAPPLMIYTLFLGSSLTLARFWFKTTKASFLIHAFNNLVVSTVLLAGLS